MLTYEEQIEALAALVEDWAVKKDKAVKGAFTSGDFVTYRLSQIFTPANWQFTILDGPKFVGLSETNAYFQLVGRLAVRFANGEEAHQDDVGIWPLKATNAKNGGVLRDTAPERYETAAKAARTDCLKNAARNLGVCFAPQTDLKLLTHIKRQAHLKKTQAEPERSAAQDTAELFGDAGPPQQPPGAEPAEKTGQATDEATETPSGVVEASLWYKRSQLISDALEEIPYYNHGKHVINALGILETKKKVITSESSDETCLKMLQAYAKVRADEKASQA